MTEAHANYGLPPRILMAAGALIVFALGLTFAARTTNVGTVQLPPAEVVQMAQLDFEDRADGSVAVRDARTGRELSVVAPGTNGFIRGVLRGMARTRKLEAMSSAGGFKLTRWSDGRLSLEDPRTGRKVDLGAFGPTNSEAFARLLVAARGT